MNIIKKEHKLCFCCMTEHEVWHVQLPETNTFKNQTVEYMAVYEYCELADEYFSSGEYLDENDISMKNAYRKKMGLLTTDDGE